MNCAKGKFASSEGAKECTNCPSAWYQPQENDPSMKCEKCPAGWGAILDEIGQQLEGSAVCRDEKWKKAEDCTSDEYLNDTFVDPSDWKCSACPTGASCEAETPWFGVVALFGYYRIPSKTIPTTFERCLYPGACLGARNREFQEMYYDTKTTSEKKTIDLAMQDLANVTEGCNEQYGFRNASRLCHTCGPNFRRSGLHECKSCPGDNSVNWLFIVLGTLIAIGLLSALVLITIGEAGNTLLSESMQKCILNYFQVSALFVNIPLRWPGPMQTLFDFQGAISTIGEHLVNPDCIATDSSAAE